MKPSKSDLFRRAWAIFNMNKNGYAAMSFGKALSLAWGEWREDDFEFWACNPAAELAAAKSARIVAENTTRFGNYTRAAKALDNVRNAERAAADALRAAA